MKLNKLFTGLILGAFAIMGGCETDISAQNNVDNGANVYSSNKNDESASGVHNDASTDFDGDGKSDFVVTRSGGDLTNGQSGQTTWFIKSNGSEATSTVNWGSFNDQPIPEDFDGDGKDDVAIWRQGNAGEAAFWILQSSTNTVRVEQFGQTGDDPGVVADYDGDGKADPAVYRRTNGQNTFFYKGSRNNPNRSVTYVPWGSGYSAVPYSGDFDGDGKNDFCVYTNAAKFVLLRSSDGQAEFVSWGKLGDTLVPGDFDGDGKNDFCVVRANQQHLNWYILERDGGGTGAVPIAWGLTTDSFAPGDYDGDGLQDIAIWRGYGNPSFGGNTQGVFYVKRSSDGRFQTFQWGKYGDNSIADWNIARFFDPAKK